MKLFHGSLVIVDRPRVDANEGNADFGAGFYLTTSLEQAIRWSKIKMRRNSANIGYVSVYDIDYDLFQKECLIKKYDNADVEWLNFVTNNRKGTPIKNVFDLSIGPVADDNVYQTIRFFETGVFDEEETIKRLKVEKLQDQWVIHTEKAVKKLHYLEAIKVEGK